jgi:hypothetical protein
MAPNITERQFRPGQNLFREGDLPRFIYIIKKGTITRSIEMKRRFRAIEALSFEAVKHFPDYRQVFERLIEAAHNLDPE